MLQSRIGILSEIRKITNRYAFPNSMFLVGSLFKDNSKLSDSDFIFDLNVMTGPSAANLMSRFSYGDDRIYETVRTVLKKEEEEYPDAIYAEIVHFPVDRARAGNVINRPVLRDYEIPYLGISGASLEKQITLDDITIQIVNDEIILRSKTHNKRIFPRLTSAHNVNNYSVPAYQFLYDLQLQGLATPVLWDWGRLGIFKHLPRVTYKNIIVSKEKWEIWKSDLNGISDIVAQSQLIYSICEVQKIPTQVLLVNDDQQLLINFDYPFCIRILLSHIKKHNKAILEEYLGNNDNCVVYGGNKRPFLNELVIPVHTKFTIKPDNNYQHITNLNGVQRVFAPQNDWLYFKIYCGEKTQESILLRVVVPFISENTASLAIEKFFFVRYRDDDPHLRIRFLQSNIGRTPRFSFQVFYGGANHVQTS